MLFDDKIGFKRTEEIPLYIYTTKVGQKQDRKWLKNNNTKVIQNDLLFFISMKEIYLSIIPALQISHHNNICINMYVYIQEFKG